MDNVCYVFLSVTFTCFNKVKPFNIFSMKRASSMSVLNSNNRDDKLGVSASHSYFQLKKNKTKHVKCLIDKLIRTSRKD